MLNLIESWVVHSAKTAAVMIVIVVGGGGLLVGCAETLNYLHGVWQ